MKILLFHLWICCCLFFSSCDSIFSNIHNKPLPTSTAHVENTDIIIPAKLHTYRWGAETDYGDSAASDVDAQPIVVPPDSKILISFNRLPDKIGRIHQVLNEKDVIVLDNSKNEILVPHASGVHTYSYNAEWPEGNVAYVIKVEVK
ncbi:hypothetical protein HZF08_35730 [Paenibacillus sp. CGMCC 1.16610]|uniref:Uncharacterized protein n=1 Tax=Paenibacillus anseongense TaxID=2682845 RepID=A0ABW9TZ43_9BACL|nr:MULTISPECIES: hypothetical protein [Paenibacillus]MBA2943628.1 hypothetical protein [Paenibacillus sp. CGMCC 1.16610]MVQ33124.1 hypothetical protein [Paenibacillus anseongense]